MSVTIDMPAKEMAVIKKSTCLDDDAEAIMQAAREFVRLVAVRELKASAGKVDFESNWQQLEELEQQELTSQMMDRAAMDQWVIVDTCVWASFFGKPNSPENEAVDKLFDPDRVAIDRSDHRRGTLRFPTERSV